MTKTTSHPLYLERVLPGISFYLASIFVPAALFLIVLAFDDFWAIFTFFGVETVILVISFLASPTLKLNTETLSIGKTSIPAILVSSVNVVHAKDTQFEKGPNLDPLAYVRFQVGVAGLVKVTLNDSADPTPYWLVSTRKPQKFEAAFQTLTN